MKTIHKYILVITDRQQVLIPGCGPVLSVANQDGNRRWRFPVRGTVG